MSEWAADEGRHMRWDEKAEEYAIGVWPPNGGMVPEVAALSIQEGARWQRDALLADDVIERAARALYELSPRSWTWEEILDGWRNKPYPDYPHTVDDLMAQARAALTAATEKDDW